MRNVNIAQIITLRLVVGRVTKFQHFTSIADSKHGTQT